MTHIKLYTIGFTKKTAHHFFETLKKTGIKRVIDVRLNNVSQLAGFAKKNDLIYFLKEICNIEYIHCPELAPTKAILEAYKKKQIDWPSYENEFLQLMKIRHIEDNMPKEVIHESCLLCSEDLPDYCHRILVAEYLQNNWLETVEIIHLT